MVWSEVAKPYLILKPIVIWIILKIIWNTWYLRNVDLQEEVSLSFLRIPTARKHRQGWMSNFTNGNSPVAPEKSIRVQGLQH